MQAIWRDEYLIKEVIKHYLEERGTLQDNSGLSQGAMS